MVKANWSWIPVGFNWESCRGVAADASVIREEVEHVGLSIAVRKWAGRRRESRCRVVGSILVATAIAIGKNAQCQGCLEEFHGNGRSVACGQTGRTLRQPLDLSGCRKVGHLSVLSTAAPSVFSPLVPVFRVWSKFQV